MSATPPRPDAKGTTPSAFAWMSKHKGWTAAIVITLLLVFSAAASGSGVQTDLVVSPAPSTVTPTPSPSATSQSPEPEQVRVPDIVGLNSGAATKKLEKLGLAVGSVTKNFSHQPPGTVLHLSIHVGGQVDEGTSISLVVAKPYPTVPSVVGMSVQQATAKLKAAGYAVSVTKQPSSLATGTVISVSPSSGTDLLPGKTVKLVVAKKIPEPTQTATPTQPDCTPGFSPCLPMGPSDYDCSGGSGDGPAYTKPGVTYRVTGSDPYGLDSDNDGYGCE